MLDPYSFYGNGLALVVFNFMNESSRNGGVL